MGKYLIFDFDGVIGNTRQASTHATSVVDGLNLDEAFAQNQAYADNKPNHTRDHTLSDEDLARIYDWTSRFGAEMYKADFGLFDDFVREIESIQTEHKAVVSSGSQQYVIPALSETQINPTHILAYENHHSKEEKIELICKDWGVELNEVFYFTDTLADVYELQNLIAKEKLIGVAWGYCGKELLLKELDSKYILDQAEDIHRVL